MLDFKKTHLRKRHSPLAFCSGRVNKTQLGLAIMEKESYAVPVTL